MSNKLLSMLDNEKSVEPEIVGRIVDKSAMVGAVVKFVGSQRVDTRMYGARQKHTFRIPTGEYFALWGDAELNASLRRIRKGDVIGMIYDGKRATPQADGATRETHAWRVKFITSKGDTLKELIAEAAPVYAAIRTAIAAQMADTREPEPDAGREYSDDDAAEAYGWDS